MGVSVNDPNATLRRSSIIILFLVAVYAVVTASSSWVLGFYMPGPLDYVLNMVLYLTPAILFVGFAVLIKLFRDRPESPFRYLRQCAQDWRLPDRVIFGGPVLAALGIFTAMFSTMKWAIPQFQKFHWDPEFSSLDAAIFGGDAWRVLQPFVGFPIITWLLNWNYHLWMGAMFGVTIFAVGMVDKPQLRLQYLFSYILCWSILGTLGAILLSSVGPCFYEAFYANDRFVALTSYLQSVDRQYPLPVLEVQKMLLEAQTSSHDQVGRGISAMPSMHVSIACLFVLFGWSISRAWGIISTIFLILIIIGSIHLGYHYAVDSLVSLLATPVIWWAAGKVARSGWVVSGEFRLGAQPAFADASRSD